MKLKIILLIITLTSVLTGQLSGQTRFNLDAHSYSGHESNIFKSPEVLYDTDSTEYIDRDSFFLSDYFLDIGYDAKYRIKKKNYNFELGNDLWYRRHFTYEEANQKKLSLDALFKKNLSKKSTLGAKYTLSWNDKLGTNIAGDELLRSFKYIGNKGELFFNYSPSKKLDLLIKGATNYKKYYEDTTDMPLDNIEINLAIKSDYTISKTHSLKMDMYYADRRYSNGNLYKKSCN